MPIQDGNTDIDGIRNAIAKAKSVTDKPTLIKVLRESSCSAHHRSAKQCSTQHEDQCAAAGLYYLSHR